MSSKDQALAMTIAAANKADRAAKPLAKAHEQARRALVAARRRYDRLDAARSKAWYEAYSDALAGKG